MGFIRSARIVQIHPTRRCNLRCLHCYSDSSPEAGDELPPELVTRVLGEAATLGYDVVSVSGGEPFMYQPLPRLLAAAKAAGMRTQLVSNGLAITPSRLNAVTGLLDQLAVSIDGMPEDHDRMRAQAGAFRRLGDRLAMVRDSGITLGLVFTLTMWNVHQIEWAVEFALASGAQLLQIHPLEASGRAAGLADDVPDEIEASAALVECLRLQRAVGCQLTIQVDVATCGGLRQIMACTDRQVPLRISDAVSPLVIEPDGTCVPLEYGFPRDYALGNVSETSLHALAGRWMEHVLPAFASGMTRMDARLAEMGEGVVVNSYALAREVLSGAAG
ncbi:radical SAM/SPASM domain-containing protein [Bradyrhizobium semiaridum]|uniref:radical SAM/SPASM domain-containing protein n=1 Tax=Bradyrhizobium semiaridum TaxID=2821404 RepID=UPI001CE28475|nr:radical SAM protein [Bradyrhizobium semiaridum]